MQTVTTDDGQVHNFPDEASEDQILEALKDYKPKKQKASPGLLKSAINFAGDVGLGAGQGILNIAPGLANLGVSGVNAVTGAHIPKVPMFDYAPHTLGADVGNIASFFTPGLAAKAVSTVPRLAGMAADALEASPTLQAATNYAKANPLKTSVAGNALLGGAYAPNAPLAGMIGGAVAPLIAPAAGAVYNKLRPSVLLRGKLSPEELKANLDATAGTQTDLGSVIGSPTLSKTYNNVLSKIPFSGVVPAMQKTASQIVDKGHGILNDLLGENKPENIQHILTESLEGIFNNHQAEKNNLYGKANSLANKENLQLDLQGFSNAAKKYAAGLENTNVLKYEPDVSALINKLQNYKNPIATDGQNVIRPTLQEANLLKGKLNRFADEYSVSPHPNDRHAAGVFRNLAGALKGDIQGSIENTGSPALANAYNEAEENYAKNFSPLLDKEIYKFTRGGADSDTLLSSFIKTGKANDRANLLNKLMEQLPDDHKNLVGYGYLSRAIDQGGALNPLKLQSLVSRNSLGPLQYKTLFQDPAMRQRIDQYVNLVGKNEKALKLMQNPETGQMNMDLLAPLLLMKMGGYLPAKMLGARGFVGKLTSEQTRQNLINKMLQNGGQ